MGYFLNKRPQETPTENKDFQSKWYFSYPILILSLVFCLPCSLLLSIARLLKVKNPKRGYKIRSLFAVIVNAGILLFIIGVGFSSSKWERDYQKSIEAGEYQEALEILDNHYPRTLSAQGLEYYLDTFALSDNYQDIDRVVLKYYETLSDKAEFETSIFDKINALTNKLSKEQIDKLKEIETEVKTAKEEKAKQLEEESRARAESESAKAEEKAKAKAEKESKAREESESVKAAKESKAREESESARTMEESKAKAESESVKAAEESKARAESEAVKAAEESKKAEESKAKAESESAKAEEEKTISQSKERIKKAIQAYKKDKSKKYIQELQKEDEDLVWSILKENISQSLNQNISDSQILLNIEKDCEIYERIFSTANSELTGLKQNLDQIKEWEQKINEIAEKYPFSIQDNVSIETAQWYVTERLSYSNPVVDALDKAFPDGSNWIAYNVTYILGSPYPGDKCIILHANETDPFSNAGSYTIDCILTDKTETLVDTKGFRRSVPIYEIVNGESLTLDKESITEAEEEIEQLWEKIREKYQINYRSNTRADSMTASDYSDTGNTMETPHVILENSSSAYLSDSDIDWMTPEQLRYAKNEIYARHGRKFNDRELQEWFTAQSWYHGRIEPENFSEDMLSAVEKANIQVIQNQLNRNSQ